MGTEQLDDLTAALSKLKDLSLKLDWESTVLSGCCPGKLPQPVARILFLKKERQAIRLEQQLNIRNNGSFVYSK